MKQRTIESMYPNSTINRLLETSARVIPVACFSRRTRELHAPGADATSCSRLNSQEHRLARFVIGNKSKVNAEISPVINLLSAGDWRFLLIALVLLFVWIPASHGQYLIGQRVWSLPSWGNYFNAQLGGTNFPPYPFFPYDPAIVPVYSLNGSDSFIYDDGEFLASQTSEPPPAPGEGAGNGDTNSIPPAYANYTSNDLWLEINITNNPATFAFLTLHGTRPNVAYQLFSNPDLGNPRWTAGQTVDNTNGTNQILFSPIVADVPQLFFKSAGGTTTVAIVAINDAIEPTSINDTGQVGVFSVFISDAVSEDLTVRYAVSGTASNGSDYINLSGTIVIPSNSFSDFISVQAKFDTLIEFDESVVVTLLPGSGYVVATNNAKASIFIEDNLGTNRIFDVVATNLNSPIGIDYHPLTNALIVSVTSFGTQSFQFVRLGTNGPPGFVTNWSEVPLTIDEEKNIAIVQITDTALTNSAGFTNGTLFFGTGSNGVIGQVSATATASNLNWVLLPEGLFRGGLYVDRSGSFGGDLIAATTASGLPDLSESVWAIKPDGQSNRIASVPAGNSHLEGVITLTNDPALWGPWAGKIITGNEGGHKIFAVGTNQILEFALGVDPEDFDLVARNQDLYCVELNSGQILRVSQCLLTNYVGNLLITESGESTLKSQLFLTHWDGTDFVMTRLPFAHTNGVPGHFEQVTFAPINLPTLRKAE